VSVFIPAYNCEKFLKSVIARIPDEAWRLIHAVHIIDDCSTDSTGIVADEICQENKKIEVTHLKKNSGYGTVVKTGIGQCKNDNCDIGICLHGDGQYPPEKIPDIVFTLNNNKLDIVQGSRHAEGTALQGGMPRYKYVAGKALTALENVVFGLKQTDYHSGYMSYSKKALQMIPFDRLSSSFDFDLEVIATARSLKLAIGEIPIPTRYADEISHVNPVNYGFRVLGVMAKYLRGGYR